MLMQSLAASGQVETGFELLRQVETSGLVSHSHEDCYALLRILLQDCHLVGDFYGASQLLAVEQLGLKACACIALALVQGSMRCWKSATNSHGA